jgi:hypothetical protein
MAALDIPLRPEEKAAEPQTVCVTGATGYVAGHIVARLLAAGHTVRRGGPRRAARRGGPQSVCRRPGPTGQRAPRAGSPSERQPGPKQARGAAARTFEPPSGCGTASGREQCEKAA